MLTLCSCCKKYSFISVRSNDNIVCLECGIKSLDDTRVVSVSGYYGIGKYFSCSKYDDYLSILYNIDSIWSRFPSSCYDHECFTFYRDNIITKYKKYDSRYHDVFFEIDS